MKILVLGGTQFVGRHIVQALVEAGHSVSILNRGISTDELPTQVERLRGDRDAGIAGLDALTGRTWDACVDVSGYTAQHVRSSAEKLLRNVGHYVFISAVSVYGDPPAGPVLEIYPRLPPADESVLEITDQEMYGRLKVTCENIVQDLYSSRCTLLRPQVIAGTHDPIGRFAYWVRRALQGREMLAPGDGSDYLQVIDARDVARFTRTVCENALTGTFNLAGPRLTWANFMTILGAQNIVWVAAETIEAAGLSSFELPLYRSVGSPRSSLMHVSNERAVERGLILTDTQGTVNDIRAWLLNHDLPLVLSPDREAELISISRAHRSGSRC